MYDLKLEAPPEIRGEFRPIATKVPGIQICEHLPQLAKLTDKLAIIRTMVGAKDRHESFQCMTVPLERAQSPGGWPEIGSVVSKLQGTHDPTLASYVNLSPKMRHTPNNYGRNSFLALGIRRHALWRDQDDMVLGDVTLDRLSDRKSLLIGIDRARRANDASGVMQGLDAFQSRAFEMLTSGKLLDALMYP